MTFNLLESSLEFLGSGTIVVGFPHDFTDESLLALEVVVVESLIEFLEHGDPLDDVERVELEAIVGRPKSSQACELPSSRQIGGCSRHLVYRIHSFRFDACVQYCI